MACLKIRMSKH